MSSIFIFVFNSILLGVGLAMDAFSVSVANSLANPDMNRSERRRIAGAFAFFQFLMPMIGWVCVHTIVRMFNSFQVFIPWIALILLAFIGGNMIREGLHPDESGEIECPKDGYLCPKTRRLCPRDGKECPVSESKPAHLSTHTLILQAVATSIDALSVGFAIAEYNGLMAFAASLIIAAVTLVICLGGIRIGTKAAGKLEGRASILGGLILIGIGLEIWISNIFF
ncbi:MAG: manganese efflux pump [Lachnospiraceae bacterium]|nr:manganese efflux pump [Lachnospiraceae bacterium]